MKAAQLPISLLYVQNLCEQSSTPALNTPAAGGQWLMQWAALGQLYLQPANRLHSAWITRSVLDHLTPCWR